MQPSVYVPVNVYVLLKSPTSRVHIVARRSPEARAEKYTPNLDYFKRVTEGILSGNGVDITEKVSDVLEGSVRDVVRASN